MMELSERLSYLAGMVDADGSIQLKMQKSGTLDMTVFVYNTDETLMDWLVLHFDGIKRLTRRKKQNPSWKTQYTWSISGQPARDLLVSIAPFMIVKKPRAELAIEAWDNRGNFKGSGRWHGMPPEIIEMRKTYVARMKDLNATGVESN